MIPSGIEPATFRFVAQYLNHCATAVTGGTHKSYGVDTQVPKRTQNFGVDKFRGTHSFGGTQSYGVNTQLWNEQKSFEVDTKFRSGHTQLRQQRILRKGICKLLNYQVSPDISSETANVSPTLI
jgi:hypothetical protein